MHYSGHMPSRGDRTYLFEFESPEQRNACHAATKARGLSTQRWIREHVRELLAEKHDTSPEDEKAAA